MAYALIKYLNEINYTNLVFSKPVSQQAEAYSDILIRAREHFVPTKQITIRPCDQPWVNSYTRLLLHKQNWKIWWSYLVEGLLSTGPTPSSF